MKSLVTILILTIFTNPLFGQVLHFHSDFEREAFASEKHDPVKIMLASDAKLTSVKYTEIKSELDVWVTSLGELRRKTNNDELFLSKLYGKIQRKQLGWFKDYALFSEVFERKNYDCVTGTALYAYLLDELGFQYRILEFDFHVLLIVNLPKKQILIESTDPLDGFVGDQKEIASRVAYYQSGQNVPGTIYRSNTYREINLQQLAGLVYFNQAVNAFNQREFQEAIFFIEKAEIVYPSSRVSQTKRLISTNAQ